MIHGPGRSRHERVAAAQRLLLDTRERLGHLREVVEDLITEADRERRRRDGEILARFWSRIEKARLSLEEAPRLPGLSEPPPPVPQVEP